MRKLLFISFVLITWNNIAQTNVYDCFINTPVTQIEIDTTTIYFAPCILFDQTFYDFSMNDDNTVKATRQIDVEPGFSSYNYNQGKGMTLILEKCNDLQDVVSFSHTNLNDVEALKKFEIGVELPDSIEQRIQDFIITNDTINGGINPYLEWQLNAEAIFTNQTTGFTKKINGFYFQNFERDTSDSNKHNWGWNPLPTNYHIRFRYSPEQLGIWNIQINVTLKDGSIFSYCPFEINVKPNASGDGFVKVATNKRVLQRNGKLFFPIGQNLPWPDDDSYEISNYTAYNVVHGGSYSHVELENRMSNMKNEGVEYARLILNPSIIDIEFEEVGNYTNRLNDAWEIDKIIDNAEALDIYLHFNMFIHYTLESKAFYTRFNWDWSDEFIPYGYPRSEGNYAYRERFGLDNNRPQDWFTNEGCKKYYKQKIRYLISRYGYSTHIALFELMSEVSNAGKAYDDVYNVSNPGLYDIPTMIKVNDPYQQDSLHPYKVALWHDEMAKYIKNDLGHKEHLLSVNYGPFIKSIDYSYAIPEVDVMTYNRYSDWIGDKYHDYQVEVRNYSNQYDKPVMFSETGPTDEFSCDRHSTYRKDAWMTAFTGVAGFNMWDGQRTPEVWHHLKNVRSFIEDNAEVADLFMGSWETGYLNDNNNIDTAKRKEAVYLIEAPISGYYGYAIGVVSNLTDNFYTNEDGTVPWCDYNKDKVPSGAKVKQDLPWSSPGLIIGTSTISDYDFDWFDQNASYLYSNGTSQTVNGFLYHPLSCVTSNCNLQTSEIPFIAEWMASETGQQFNKQKSSNPTERIIPIENEPSQRMEVKNQLLVYPNPAQNSIQVVCTDPTIIKFQLVDVKGKTMKTINVKEISKLIDITNLESGIFVILGLDKSNTIKYQKRWVKL